MDKTKIDHLCGLLKTRLVSTTQTNDIFSAEDLGTFISLSVSQLESLLGWSDTDMLATNKYNALIVQGALVMAWRRQAILERGREIAMTDTVLTYTPPDLSNLLLDAAQMEAQDYLSKIQMMQGKGL